MVMKKIANISTWSLGNLMFWKVEPAPFAHSTTFLSFSLAAKPTRQLAVNSSTPIYTRNDQISFPSSVYPKNGRLLRT